MFKLFVHVSSFSLISDSLSVIEQSVKILAHKMTLYVLSEHHPELKIFAKIAVSNL